MILQLGAAVVEHVFIKVHFMLLNQQLAGVIGEYLKFIIIIILLRLMKMMIIMYQLRLVNREKN